MLTGVELAGIILAVVPILTDGLDRSERGYASMQDWWRYRNVFKRFQHDIGLQTLLLRQQIEHLLQQIVTSPAQMSALIDDPGGPAWSDKELDVRLHQILPDNAYEYYLRTAQYAYDVLAKVRVKFGLGDDSTPAGPEEAGQAEASSQWWKRQHKRTKFAFSRSERTELLAQLARHNRELEDVLRSSDRIVATRRTRKHQQPSTFRRLHGRAARLHDALSQRWTCPCSSHHSSHLSLDDYSALLAEKDPRESVAALERHFAVLFRSSFAAADETPWAMLEAMIEVAKSPSDPPAQPPTPDVTGKATEPPTRAGTRSEIQVLTGRRVSFATSLSGLTITAEPRKDSATSVTRLEEVKEFEELDETGEILDLCQYIEKARGEGNGYGVLRHDSKSLYTFRAGNVEADKVATLESLLELQPGAGSCSLNRLQRLYIALRLVVSVLPMHGTPWMSEHWGKANVMVQFSKEQDRHSPGLAKIYITPRQADNGQPKKQADCMKILRCLGIVLLELCFGRRLEDYEGWQQYLGADGKQNDFTSVAAAVEWQEKLPGEAGENMAEAVRKCLVFAFETKARSLEDEDLAARFYDGVVQPVQEHWNMFFGRPL